MGSPDPNVRSFILEFGEQTANTGESACYRVRTLADKFRRILVNGIDLDKVMRHS
jgi:hypothetical protein